MPDTSMSCRLTDVKSDDTINLTAEACCFYQIIVILTAKYGFLPRQPALVGTW